MTIVITGGSGYIGNLLTQALIKKGHTVIVVDKVAPKITHEKLFFIQCDLSVQSLPYNVLERTDAIVNLVGSSLYKNWSPEYKAEIRNSRVRSIKTIISAISEATIRPTVFVSTSSINIYKNSEQEIVDEHHPKTEGFLASVLEEAETEALKAEELGVRTVIIRSATILGRGGFLVKLLKTARFGFLVNYFKKNFSISWIAEEDIINVYIFALETKTLQGTVNASTTKNVRYKDLMKKISQVINRPIIITLPKFLVTPRNNELYEERIKDFVVLPQKLIDKGFQFKYPEIKEALESILIRRNERSK